MKRTIVFVVLSVLAGSPLAPVLRADEGMWLLNQPPRELLKKKYNFDLDDAWLERVMKASIRFNNGGSGSFVSPLGLVVTNHHIGADSLQKLSTRDKDYYRDGFLARGRQEELKCPDLELNVLDGIEDVTARVQSAVKPDLGPAEAAAARKAILAQIEKEATERTKLRCEIVTLYQGGQYHLYQYRKYTDVRLVMAPEHDIAFFGGDTDNFEYPRFNLDVCFFRVYDNGEPVPTPHHFKWSQTGPVEGDVVFVSGHPGSTNRLETLARLKHRRDLTLPYTLSKLRYLEALLVQFAERGPEERRMAAKDLYGVANARKAITGQYQGLLDPKIISHKADDEKKLRAQVTADAELAKAHGAAWERIRKAQSNLAGFEREYALLEGGDAFNSRLFRIARHLVRMQQELALPEPKRLTEYRGSALESLKFQLASPAPIDIDLERVKLAGSLSFLAESLGGEHSLVVKALAGKSPAARAAELIGASKLADVQLRKQLLSKPALTEKHADPMLRFAALLDGEARQLRKRFETEVAEEEKQAYAQISQARFKLFGASIPPDATFTLRLAFGVARGYQVDGAELPYTTTFAGAFDRADKQGHREPFNLPRRWLDGKTRVDLKTPFNFVSTADTIGGNSGSPVLNRAGELVGINFDRNRHGLVRNYVYTDEQARHISVHARAVLEALRSLYQADNLVKEITNP